MTKEQIEAIRARCEAADSALLAIQNHGLSSPGLTVSIYNSLPDTMSKDLRNLISSGNQYIPALLAEVERLQATLEQTWEWDMYQCAQREIYRLRSAQPVRCSDCTYYYKGCCSHGVSDLTERKQDDYCSFGERKG